MALTRSKNYVVVEYTDALEDRSKIYKFEKGQLPHRFIKESQRVIIPSILARALPAKRSIYTATAGAVLTGADMMYRAVVGRSSGEGTNKRWMGQDLGGEDFRTVYTYWSFSRVNGRRGKPIERELSTPYEFRRSSDRRGWNPPLAQSWSILVEQKRLDSGETGLTDSGRYEFTLQPVTISAVSNLLGEVVNDTNWSVAQDYPIYPLRARALMLWWENSPVGPSAWILSHVEHPGPSTNVRRTEELISWWEQMEDNVKDEMDSYRPLQRIDVSLTRQKYYRNFDSLRHALEGYRVPYYINLIGRV